MSVLAVSRSCDRTSTLDMLRQENQTFQGTGGVSQGNRQQGFRPAFRDDATGQVYLSAFANGRPAPFHMLDGLPDEVVTSRNKRGKVTTLKSSVVSGFVNEHSFYNRAQAALLVSKLST